jgi:hypothetical protein
MSKVLEKATAHFRNRISGEMKKVVVPEWECDVYFKSASNLKEESRVLELSQQGKAVEALVESLIIKARNADGSKMFTTMDRPVLMNEVDPTVLIRLVGEINLINQEASNLDDVEKN